jgi:hypothetical protein
MIRDQQESVIGGLNDNAKILNDFGWGVRSNSDIASNQMTVQGFPFLHASQGGNSNLPLSGDLENSQEGYGTKVGLGRRDSSQSIMS